MIENILIIDCETTGLDLNRGAQLIELCCILYNVKNKTILQIYSTLFPCNENPAEYINHISPEITNLYYSRDTASYNVYSLVFNCDAIVAHNKGFDRKFFDKSFVYPNKPWICTQRDFSWPLSLERIRLQDICEASGITYEDAHRAYTDCMFLVKCFNKVDDLYERFNAIPICK